MSGRMAMNNPWDVARIDREVYGDLTQNTKTREEILKEYAAWAQIEQTKSIESGYNLTNNVLVKPLINLFAGEFENRKWRRVLTELAADKKQNAGRVEWVINETIRQFGELNDEALQKRNGEKVTRHNPQG